MFKKIILFFFCLCICFAAFTQPLHSAVISAAGDVNKTDRMYLQWTLGEPFIESIVSKNLLYTQGFHQPIIMARPKTAITEANHDWFNISIFPNPVQTFFNAVIEKGNQSRISLELQDINGQSLLSKTSNAKYEVINFNLSAYSSGIYTLIIRNTNGSLYKAVKIIKAL